MLIIYIFSIASKFFRRQKKTLLATENYEIDVARRSSIITNTMIKRTLKESGKRGTKKQIEEAQKKVLKCNVDNCFDGTIAENFQDYERERIRDVEFSKKDLTIGMDLTK